MTKQPEATSVLGKANSIIRQMMTVQQEPASPVTISPATTTPVGSPRTLAIKRAEVEEEYIEEAAKLDQAIRGKEEELKSALLLDNIDNSQVLLQIEGDLNVLRDAALSYRKEKLEIADKLDDLVGKKQAESMKEMGTFKFI